MLVGALAPCFHERHPIRAAGAGVGIDTTWSFCCFSFWGCCIVGQVM